MGRSVELSLSQNLTTTAEVEVQILTQSQAESMGIKALKFVNDREAVAFRRDGKDQILEADILPGIDIAEFMQDDDYIDEVLLEAERALKDFGK